MSSGITLEMLGNSGHIWEVTTTILKTYNGKGEKSECKNYRGISQLSVVGKIYAGILVDRVRRVTGFD